ncbi:MAG: hypothetical protein ABSA96_04715 [Candidatus Acidiferrales bacterium]|jgi:hypothetical protein
MADTNERHVTGVVCIHCGMNTVVPGSTNQWHRAGDFWRPQVSVVRCTKCGKEAPYLAEEIIVFNGLDVARYAA